MSSPKDDVPRETTNRWSNPEILRRVNQLRGLRLAETGKSVTWTDLGRVCGWSATTSSDLSSGRRDLRIPEAGLIARYFGVSAGWLAFGEGRKVPVPAHTPGIPTDEGEDAYDAIDRDVAAQRAKSRPKGKGR